MTHVANFARPLWLFTIGSVRLWSLVYFVSQCCCRLLQVSVGDSEVLVIIDVFLEEYSEDSFDQSV